MLEDLRLFASLNIPSKLRLYVAAAPAFVGVSSQAYGTILPKLTECHTPIPYIPILHMVYIATKKYRNISANDASTDHDIGHINYSSSCLPALLSSFKLVGSIKNKPIQNCPLLSTVEEILPVLACERLLLQHR